MYGIIKKNAKEKLTMKKAACFIMTFVLVCSFALTACLFVHHTCDACACIVCEMCRDQEKCAADTRDAEIKCCQQGEDAAIKLASALLPADTPAERKDKLTD